jgi:FHS family Na+ dependent glucose MFS transporter 1
MQLSLLKRISAIPQDRLRNTIAYYFIFIVLGLVMSTTGPALSTLAAHTGVTLETISSIFIVSSLGSMAGATTGGWLVDRVRGHLLLAICAFLALVLFSVLPLLTSFWLLMALYFLFSSVQIMVDVGTNTLIVWTHGKSVAPYMNGLHFAFGFGGFFAPQLVARSLACTGDIHWAYWTVALLTIPFVFSVWRIPSPQRPAKSPIAPTSPSAASKAQPAPKSAHRFIIVMVGLIFFFMAGVEMTIFGWAFNYGVAIGMDKLTTAAAFASAMWGAFSLSRLISIPVSTRLSLRATIYVVLIGMAMSGLLFIAGGDSQLVAWLAVCAIGFFVGPVFPTGLSYIGSRMSISGAITSFVFIMSSVGSMLFPFLAGQLFEPIGVFTLRWMLFVLSALCLAAFVVLDRKA